MLLQYRVDGQALYHDGKWHVCAFIYMDTRTSESISEQAS